MKYIYVGTASSDKDIEELFSKYSRKKTVYVQQKWDYTFCKALEEICGEDFYAISYPPIQTFPSGKALFFRRARITGIRGVYIGGPNIPLIKQLCSVIAVEREIKKIEKEYPDEDICILTHTVYLQSLLAANSRKKKNRNITVVSLVPDLPDYTTNEKLSDSKVNLGLLTWYRRLSLRQKMNTDGYVCFAEHQMEKLNADKPYIVMEGFVDATFIDKVKPAVLSRDKKIFTYAGNLKSDSGVDLLVDAFHIANCKNAELWIFGEGELKEVIEKKGYPQVKLMGVKSREEIIAIEKASYCLVNPRPIHEAYARYSFPSKLLEYMATGVPVVTTHIPSIGQEYLDKMIVIENYCLEEFVDKLRQVASGKWNEIGTIASQYVHLCKNVNYQAKRVVDYVTDKQ